MKIKLSKNTTLFFEEGYETAVDDIFGNTHYFDVPAIEYATKNGKEIEYKDFSAAEKRKYMKWNKRIMGYGNKINFNRAACLTYKHF